MISSSCHVISCFSNLLFFGKPKFKVEYDIKKDVKELSCKNVYLIELVHVGSIECRCVNGEFRRGFC